MTPRVRINYRNSAAFIFFSLVRNRSFITISRGIVRIIRVIVSPSVYRSEDLPFIALSVRGEAAPTTEPRLCLQFRLTLCLTLKISLNLTHVWPTLFTEIQNFSNLEEE